MSKKIMKLDNAGKKTVKHNKHNSGKKKENRIDVQLGKDNVHISGHGEAADKVADGAEACLKCIGAAIVALACGAAAKGIISVILH